jgi:uncharacterized protein YbjT (DUF2867 family)
MKQVITGGAGNISKPLALALLKAGHQVTVLGRNPENLEVLTENGATPAIGSLEDASYVSKAFAGADAAYLMIPPNFITNDFRSYQRSVIRNYVDALKANQVKKVVVLSSVGAHMGQGAGPVDGLAELEQAITHELPQADAVFLRPAFFFYNLYQQAGMVKHLGIMGSNYPMTKEKLFLVDPADIADAAFQWLDKASFTGKTVYNLYSDEKSTDEIAAQLSAAIGKPGTPWVAFPDDQALAGMLQAGLKPDMAKDYLDMGIALREGIFQADFRAKGAHQGSRRLEDFAPSFASFFNQ